MTNASSLIMDKSNSKVLDFETLHGIIGLFSSLTKDLRPKAPVVKKSEYQPLIMAALQAYSNCRPEDGRKLLGLIGSRKRVLNAAEDLIASHFGVQIGGDADWKGLY